MWPFWAMFLVPALGVLMPGRLRPSQAWLPWLAVFLAFSLMMGLRHEVGGDWENYIPLFKLTAARDFGEVMERGDPGYYGMNWIVARLGGDIYSVNLICALVMMSGTVVFCRRQPNPWLSLLVAVPYMLVVVGMGYTRQAAALGFAMLGLAALGDGRVRKFLLWVAIGATFHKSAVLLLPVAALAASRNRLLTAVLVGATTALLYYLLLAEDSEKLWQNYVVDEYQSEGGLIRVLMNVVPALLFMWFGKRLTPASKERKLWLWMSILALVCLPLVPLASTAVDRVALYLIPIQLYVFSRLPVLAPNVRGRTLVVLGIVGYYAAVQFVWLNFATHAFAWVPYQFMPL